MWRRSRALCEAIVQGYICLCAQRAHGRKESVMAEVIEFYVPQNFRSPQKCAPELQLGKIIKFRLPAQKSA
jgi:hypothetical protein